MCGGGSSGCGSGSGGGCGSGQQQPRAYMEDCCGKLCPLNIPVTMARPGCPMGPMPCCSPLTIMVRAPPGSVRPGCPLTFQINPYQALQCPCPCPPYACSPCGPPACCSPCCSPCGPPSCCGR